MLLLDSDFVIEIQRGSADAANWLASTTEELGLPAPVAWEILYGSRNKAELRKSNQFLTSFNVISVSPADSALVESLIISHVLSSGLSLADFLIAAQAISRNATLVTFNIKHFKVLPNLDVLVPYQR